MSQESAGLQPARKVPNVPPRGMLTTLIAVRNFLSALVRKMVPPQIGMLEFLLGYMYTNMAGAAARLGVADHLAKGPMTAAELAKATGANEATLARLMRALVSCGVFARGSDGRYRLNGLGETLRTGPGSMRDVAILLTDKWFVDAWRALPETVRTGTNGVRLVSGKMAFELLAGTPESETANSALGSLAAQDAPAHARAYDFSAAKSVCDVGGGTGMLLVHILALYPHLKGILFDQPHVVAEAPPLLAAWGMKDRIQTVGGSFFESIPPGCDLYMMRSVLHDWDDPTCVAILKKVREVMTPSARLLIVEHLMIDHDAPLPGKLQDIQMMVISDQGMERTPEQYGALLPQAGMKLLRIIPTSSPYAIHEAGLAQ